ncbi:MAG TPA: flagellar assembly protein FliH [Porticoccus sp.]|nr:flagellar assembly protein FliH [Porticoccus sp.]
MSDIPQIETILDNSDRWRPWTMDELSSTAIKNIGSVKTKLKAQRGVNSDTVNDPTYEEAKKTGYNAGLKEGINDGHKKGFLAGKKEGYQQGLKEGRAEAKKELDHQVGNTLAPLSPLVSRFEEAIALLDSTISNELVELALAIGCQLARDRLDEKPELMLEIVRELLYMEPSMDSKPRLWLHPDDLSLVQQHLGGEFEAAGWRLQPDKNMSRGGCKLTSDHEECDATWETRCQAILAQVRHRSVSQPGIEWDEAL